MLGPYLVLGDRAVLVLSTAVAMATWEQAEEEWPGGIPEAWG